MESQSQGNYPENFHPCTFINMIEQFHNKFAAWDLLANTSYPDMTNIM